MSELPHESDYLKSKGWRPIRADVPPQQTGWVDPIGTKVLTFGEASQEQNRRDTKESETK